MILQTTVGFAGMGSAEETELRALFAQANAASGDRFVEADQSRAEVLLVDVDSIHGHMTWLQTQSDPERRIIALAARATPHSDFCIVKPASLQAMAEALAAMAAMGDGQSLPTEDAGADIGREHAAAADGAPVAQSTPTNHGLDSATVDAAGEAVDALMAGPPADADAPAAQVEEPGQSQLIRTAIDAAPDVSTSSAAVASARPAVVAPPRLPDYLVANALAGPSRLKLDDAPELVVDPGARTYLGPVQLKGFEAYARAECIEATDWQPLEPDELARLAARSGQPQPWARLQWLAGLYGSPGRLAAGCSDEDRFELVRWPQIEREFPRHFRIATTMMKGPGTAAEVAEAAGSPVADVIDFINASLATGQARKAEPEPEAELVPAQRGLLDRLKGLRGS